MPIEPIVILFTFPIEVGVFFDNRKLAGSN